jgi:AraC-like DNA-binding protein
MFDYKDMVCSLIGYIEQNIKGKPSYSEMEQVVGFSYHHIRQMFRRTMNISLSRYILSRKIANIAFEIRHTDKYFVDIACEYDFSGPDIFTRAFHRITGIRPSEFKASNHVCGRRIICPGVYAPVILSIDNPLLTFPKLKEVNETGEMVKTSDSCILYGVPKVHFGREWGGKKQWTPFPMCLQSVLNYMGQNISYAEVMAYSGAAFRQRWDTQGWNVAAVDIRFTYEKHLRPFELAFKGAGRNYRISENPDKPKSVTKKDATELIRSEIDCGRPVIALGVVGPPEAAIVTGYRNNGETLLGWSLYQDSAHSFGGDCGIDETGYFIKNNWWENTEAIMSIGEDINTLTPAKEVLENALMLMTKERIETYVGTSSFYGGQAAYKAWANAVENDADFNSADINEIGYCQRDAEKMLHEERSFAASYINMLAEKYPTVAPDLKKCAELLSAASECVPKMRKARGSGDINNETMSLFREKKVREQIAFLIRQAAQYEKDACEILKTIINKL